MQQFNVSGMTCQHCIRAVTQAVQGIDPAASVQIDLATGHLAAGTTASAAAIIAAIEAEGYRATTA